MGQEFFAVKEEDVYALSEKGSRVLSEPGTSLSPVDLEVLVLIDGKATVARVIRSAQGLAPGIVRETLRKLLQSQLIESADKVKSDAIDAGGFFSVDAPADGSGETEAALGVSSLHDHGYFVRIARRAANPFKPVDGKKMSVLAVEDDPNLCKLLRSYFTLEGYTLRTVATPAEIDAALGQSPRPDIALLDVTLPDVDGFDVLAKMRQHPAFRSVPVIMLTAKATREAVLKGLLGGADGYVTKPFEMENLVNAVRTVLGLDGAASGGGGVEANVNPQDGVDPEYRDRLLEKIARLETLCADLAAGKVPAARLADLHREVHTIAGSAKMFGLDAAGSAARAAEDFLEAYRGGDPAPGPDEWTRIKFLLEAVKRSAQGR